MNHDRHHDEPFEKPIWPGRARQQANRPPRSLRRRRRERAGRLSGGVVLVGLGSMFLAQQVGVIGVGLDELWPVILMLVGGSQLIAWALGWRPRARQASSALLVFLLGCFFLCFTVGPLDWSDHARLWPVYPILVGTSTFLRFLIERRIGVLMLSVLLVILGMVSLVATHGYLPPDLTLTLLRFGVPLAVIALGLYVVATGLAQGRRGSDAGEHPGMGGSRP